MRTKPFSHIQAKLAFSFFFISSIVFGGDCNFITFIDSSSKVENASETIIFKIDVFSFSTNSYPEKIVELSIFLFSKNNQRKQKEEAFRKSTNEVKKIVQDNLDNWGLKQIFLEQKEQISTFASDKKICDKVNTFFKEQFGIDDFAIIIRYPVFSIYDKKKF